MPSRSPISPRCRRATTSPRHCSTATPTCARPAAPGNLYSKPQKIHFDPAQGGSWKLELTQQIPPEQLPPDTDQIKFIKIQSKRLSEFYGRPIFLRAGVILPRDYAREPSRRYPLWVRIGGLNGRYTGVLRQMEEKSEFRKTWLADDTPRLILLQLDGAGPNGDPYYVNSANNGPFGDALVEELIPHVEATFRAVGQPRARFLSGTSTGGWVCLALQVFYPDFFNGAWSSCPDPVDFRALELVNIYQDDNAYVNRYGNERPSARDAKGDVKLLMRREVGVENLLGRGNSYTCSGEQWGDWNAVFGPRGADGRPVPLWDPQTGKINHAVAEQWKKYDLRLVLEAQLENARPQTPRQAPHRRRRSRHLLPQQRRPPPRQIPRPGRPALRRQNRLWPGQRPRLDGPLPPPNAR